MSRFIPDTPSPMRRAATRRFERSSTKNLPPPILVGEPFTSVRWMPGETLTLGPGEKYVTIDMMKKREERLLKNKTATGILKKVN